MTNALRTGGISAPELAQTHLDRIAARREVNAYINVTGDMATIAAASSDQSRNLPLAGIPIAIKDNITLEGVPCTCGSRMLENWIAPYDATVVERLKAAGAVILGKTNCDEFAMGSSNENSHFGSVQNPNAPGRVPGGSSGGSAAAVADFQAAAALGSDTGGSVRLPAAFCGVVGLKPTYGAVSRWGLVAFASSLDQVGVLGRTVDDTKRVFEVIRGYDPKDSTSMRNLLASPIPETLTIGLPREYYGNGLDPEVRRAVTGTAQALQAAGHRLVDVSLPNSPYTIAAYYIICCAEASANLARYDGVKYGYRSAATQDLSSMYGRTRSEGFGMEVKRRILLGTYVLSAGYFDAYYATAQKVRARIAADFANAFESVDCLLTPTAPTCAFKLGEKLDDPLAMYLMDIYTTSVNLAGLPAISVPCGRSNAGLPIGAQIIGRAFEENLIMSVASGIEEACAM
ncbi:MAG: Asp-tRNA(Asn)/Glu-tRNA(Gln) amidotransferase subunit GatA [candidate division Zixibacteria bacterium]|nr:Asp-tRNA(Asn)/Glu-tRNA(Gln) amidotransferase subunit GatA [candidate division Zixibacteria bacterium]